MKTNNNLIPNDLSNWFKGNLYLIHSAVSSVFSGEIRKKHYQLEFEDLVSEACLAIVKGYPKYDPSKAKFETFAYHIAKMKTLELIRYNLSKKRYLNESEIVSLSNFSCDEDGLHIEELISRPEESGSPVEREVENIDLYEQVLDIVKDMPEFDRSIMEYYIVNDRPHQNEIAAYLGVSPSTVCSHLKKCFSYIRERIDF